MDNYGHDDTQGDRLLLPVNDAAARTGLSRSTFYELLKAGAIGSVTVGRRRLVPAAELERFVATLIEGQAR